MTTANTPITRETHPELFEEMDKAAAQFWAYPSPEWQDDFIQDWLEANSQGAQP